MLFFFFQAEDGIRDLTVTGVQTCALPILVPAGVGDHPAPSYVVRHTAYGGKSPPKLESPDRRSEEHTFELQSQANIVCRLLLVKKKKDATLLPTSPSDTLNSRS